MALAAPLAGRADDNTENSTSGSATDDAAACEAAHANLPHGTLLDLLDPDAPADRRAAALATYQRLADLEHCPEFDYTLGLLYRHGPYLPGNLLPQDIEKARELIQPMALDGYVDAFADLAEMEMRHANARKAMKWTQLYLHFVQDVKADYIDDIDSRHFQRSAYNADLLARVEFVWRHLADPPLPRRLIDQDLDAWLAKHEDHVARRMRERMEGVYQRGPAQVAMRNRVIAPTEDCHLTDIHDIDSASASWIVEVLPSGETGRIVLENFVPNVEVARKLRTCLSRYRFAPSEGAEPITVRMPMVFGTPGDRQLRRD